MLFPISDDNSDRHTTPYINYLLIAINILVFVMLQGMGNNLHFTYAYSTVPAEILQGIDIVTNDLLEKDPASGQVYRLPGLQATPIPVYFTMLTSMFMHGGWAHLLGNMLYLWIFGDNIENRLGHIRYLLFYLICGIIASLTHVLTTNFLGHDTLVPSLGASGAISGVLGGYMLLFPRRKVHALFLGIFMVTVPSIVALGLWIVFQLVSGVGSIGAAGGGVAYGAHIGGFIAGLVLIKFFDPGPGAMQPKQTYRRNSFR